MVMFIDGAVSKTSQFTRYTLIAKLRNYQNQALLFVHLSSQALG